MTDYFPEIKIGHCTPKHISDEQLLAWILDHTILICRIDTHDPVLVFRGRVNKAILHEQGGSDRLSGGKRWRWRISDGSKLNKGVRVRRRRCIMRAKLVWMYDNRSLVPPDHLIHHRNENGETSLCDARWNLEAMHIDKHNAIHYGEEF